MFGMVVGRDGEVAAVGSCGLGIDEGVSKDAMSQSKKQV
jgi:hypothetical protein